LLFWGFAFAFQCWGWHSPTLSHTHGPPRKPMVTLCDMVTVFPQLPPALRWSQSWRPSPGDTRGPRVDIRTVPGLSPTAHSQEAAGHRCRAMAGQDPGCILHPRVGRRSWVPRTRHRPHGPGQGTVGPSRVMGPGRWGRLGGRGAEPRAHCHIGNSCPSCKVDMSPACSRHTKAQRKKQAAEVTRPLVTGTRVSLGAVPKPEISCRSEEAHPESNIIHQCSWMSSKGCSSSAPD
jgi:hypothetical protein